MNCPAISVLPVHFDDFSGHQFERLVFAHLLRSGEYKTLEWYGQSGSDLGRDIWGERSEGSSVCVQCVNRRTTPAAKVIHDLNNIARAPDGVPKHFLVVCAANVSARTRDAIKAHARKIGVTICEIWSGSEFEERLRQGSEALLRRFLAGEAFPDNPAALRQWSETAGTDDAATIRRFLQLFDRPAFLTPFHQESSLGAFRKAIGDTIQAINTGVWQTREGTTIERIRSRHQLSDFSLRAAMESIVKELATLRARFEDLIREGQILPCGCGNPDCPTFFLSEGAIAQMHHDRAALVEAMRSIASQSQKIGLSPSQAVNVINSTNAGIIANQVVFRGKRSSAAIILPNSIGAEPAKYNYVDYLIKRLAEFRSAGQSFGQRRSGPVHPGVIRKQVEREFGGLAKDLPADRFGDVVLYLKYKIDRTALGRRNQNNPNYHSFQENGASE